MIHQSISSNNGYKKTNPHTTEWPSCSKQKSKKWPNQTKQKFCKSLRQLGSRRCYQYVTFLSLFTYSLEYDKYTIVFCASEFDEVEDDNEENISSDDVDDEDYVEKRKNGKHNVFFL